AHPIARPPGVAAAAGDFPIIANTDGFSIASDNPGAAGRRPARPYRPRSNTGPMIVIFALLAVMIPLLFLVYKVVREQLAPGAMANTAAKTEKPAPTTEDKPADEEPASSPNEAEE
ncbi:MAG: hypothetical protein ACREJM_14555, partial [Candidatus Saccharimonadales bacterium]